MRHLRTILGLTLLAALAPAMAGADPLRTLVYRFSYDAHGFGGTPSMGGGVVSENGTSGSAGRTGKITVDVISATPDGGLVVDVGEDIDRRYPPLQRVRCAVYGQTLDVVCDQNVGETIEEHALLFFLGRDFYDPSRLDAQGSWHPAPRVHGSGDVSVKNTLTVADPSATPLTIAVKREEVSRGFQATSTASSARGQSDRNVTLELISDSMASPGPVASPNPH